MPASPALLAREMDLRLKARLGEWAHLLTVQEAQLTVLEAENRRLREELALWRPPPVETESPA